MEVDQSFAEFKENFYRKVKSFSLFDAGEINLLKVVLDGLKVDYQSRGKINVFIFRSPFYINCFYAMKRARALVSGKGNSTLKDQLSKLKNSPKKKFLTIDPGGRSMVEEGKVKSFYFENIHRALGLENVTVVVEGKKGKTPPHDLQVSDYNSDLVAAFGSLNGNEKKMVAQLKSTYAKIENEKCFSAVELKNIQIAFQQFFIQYSFWNRVLQMIQPEKVLLWPHYHREGCICAFKQKNIPVIELQHGLIAPEDIFYVLPMPVKEVEKKALFADEIWVYGQFWKNQLLKGAGYSEEQIKIGGYHPIVSVPSQETIAKVKAIFAGKKIILVTTQTFMQDYFCQYILFLSNDLLERKMDYCILVKLHPAETVDRYEAIAHLPNVKIINENLDVLFSAVDIHVSVFSTTLFDAVRYGLPNYSVFFEPFREYIAFFETEGVVKVISPKQNPLDFPISRESKPKEFYFETFQASHFNQLLSK